MDERIDYSILNFISILFSIICIALAVSIQFTDMFWITPGIFIFIISILASTMGSIYSLKRINITTLGITIISLIIFLSPLVLS